MIDLEKVIKGLECCEASEILACESCPYREENDSDLGCFDTLQADALETLKWAKRKINRLKKILDIALKERPYIVRCKDCEYCEYPNSEKEWCIKGIFMEMQKLGSALTARERKSMMIKASDLIAKFQQALDEHWGYIYGKTHEMWSEEKQRAYAKEYAKDPDRANSVKYGDKWAGHWVTDCSGLFAWSFNVLGGHIAHGSNTIWDKYTTYGESISPLRAGAIKPGAAVFTGGDINGKHDHIGLYIGEDTVIEARGCKAGVTTSNINDGRWKYWALLKGVEYSSEKKEDEKVNFAKVVLPTGASGKTVNMRYDDSKNAKIMKQVPVGTIVEVLEDRGEWMRIVYDGSQGYMMANYLEYLDQDGEAGTDEVTVPRTELEGIYDKIGDWLGRRG